MSNRKCERREWGISEPANIRSASCPKQPAASDKAEVQDDATERAHPEAPGIQPRKCHIASADHQGNEVVGESENERHGCEKNHRRAVHREHSVECLR